MKKLFLALCLCAIITSCSKIDKSQIVGKWKNEAVDQVGTEDNKYFKSLVIAKETFNEDGSWERDLDITLNGRPIFGDMKQMGTWQLNNDIISIHINKQFMGGDFNDVDNTEERKITSIKDKEILYIKVDDEEQSTNTLRRIE